MIIVIQKIVETGCDKEKVLSLSQKKADENIMRSAHLVFLLFSTVP
jgi:hypothetical protein